MNLVRPQSIFPIVLIITTVCLNHHAMSAEQPSQATLPFVDLVKAAETNYANGEIAKAREQLGEFLRLSEQDALRRILRLERELAEICVRRGDPDYARTILERGITLVQRTVGSEHSEMATALATIGLHFFQQGDSARALDAFQRSVKVAEKSFGLESLEVADLLESAAECHAALGQYAEAISGRERALEYRELLVETSNLTVAVSRIRLAALYLLKGDFALAISLIGKNIAVQEAALGSAGLEAILRESPTVEPLKLAEGVGAIANLLSRSYAQLCQAKMLLGRYDEALKLANLCRDLNERLFGLESPVVADDLLSLAAIRSDSGEQQQDELVLPLLTSAYQILEKNYGKDNSRLSTVLNNLGLANKTLGRESIAADYFERALSLVEKEFGKDSIACVTLLMNLGALRRDEGEYAVALPLLLRSFGIARKHLGESHRTTTLIACHLAIWQIKQGIFPALVFEHGRPGPDWRMQLLSELPLLSDADAEGLNKRLYFITEGLHSMGDVKYRTDSDMFPRHAAKNLAMGKAMLEEASVARTVLDSAHGVRLTQLRDDYRSLQSQLQSLDERQPAAAESVGRRGLLLAEARKIEDSLSSFDETISQSLQERELSMVDLAAKLSRGAALIDFVSYRRWDYHEKNKNWKERRYAAYLTFPLAEGSTNVVVERVDLGEAAPIDGAVAIFAQRMSAGQYRARDLAAAMEDLSRLVYAPLARHLTNVAHLIVCPDGQLNRLPFEMLRHNGRYLIEDKTISYVTSGREIARLAQPRDSAKTNAPLVMGNPDFDLDLGSSRREEAHASSADAGAPSGEQSLSLLTSAPTRFLSRDFRGGVRFTPLPGSEIEATNVARFLGDETILRIGPEAREADLKRVVSPRVLHLATHGFFLPDQEREHSDRMDAPLMLASDRPWRASGSDWENPMVRCGLALAGANHAGAITNAVAEDGILTGLEAALLNLQGTELVILSACDSGTGEVKIGEGVMSLRRAFRIAGAETVLASHWKVSDRATSQLMTEFMRRWQAGESRSAAWRGAQLSLLQSKGAKDDFSDPYFWAAFTLTGQWRR